MKKLISALLGFTLFFMVVCSIGCGKGSKGSAEEARSLLGESAQAMSGVSSYREKGTQTINAEVSASAGTGGIALTTEFQAEVQIKGEEINQHMVATVRNDLIGDNQTETYLVGNQFYEYIPKQGWVRMDYNELISQNVNMALLEFKQLEKMAEMAQDPRVVGKDGGKIEITFILTKDFYESAEVGDNQSSAGGQAPTDQQKKETEVHMWLLQDSKLIDSMKLKSVVENVPPFGNAEQTMEISIYDYNQNIEVVLPEEAKGAKESVIPAM